MITEIMYYRSQWPIKISSMMPENRNGQEISIPASGIKIMHIYAIQLLAVIEVWNIKTCFWKKKIENFT